MFLSDEALHVTTGFLILNLWSFAGDQDRANVNAMTLQPFLNYNLPKGWYLTSSPLITANWRLRTIIAGLYRSAAASGASSKLAPRRSDRSTEVFFGLSIL